ncbi:hypothetical protein RF11_10453 [Thelohanellus kitauei]|uniref:Uncharacterized protein n=1 Tax=Thelohanellus kitauei TaxID=669202 RepID=A0A0C2JBC7_THEKT|nr:hypothetical protein RF11_10453 [Thelohanellus kitauei]
MNNRGSFHFRTNSDHIQEVFVTDRDQQKIVEFMAGRNRGRINTSARDSASDGWYGITVNHLSVGCTLGDKAETIRDKFVHTLLDTEIQKEITRPFSSNDATLEDVYRKTAATLQSKENNTNTSNETESVNTLGGEGLDMSTDNYTLKVNIKVVSVVMLMDTVATLSCAGVSLSEKLVISHLSIVPKIRGCANNQSKTRGMIDARYSSFFQQNNWGITNHTATIHLKERAILILHKPRRVLLAIKMAVKEEQKQLVESGVIEKIDPLKELLRYACPAVNISKEDNITLISTCLSYHTRCNPLMTFWKIERWKKLSVLDSKDGYLPITYDENSKNLAGISTHDYRGSFKRFQACNVTTYTPNRKSLLDEMNFIGHKIDCKWIYPLESKIYSITQLPEHRTRNS